MEPVLNWAGRVLRSRMFDFQRIDIELAKQGKILTEEGKAFYETFVLCGSKVSIPEHFVAGSLVN